MGGKWQRKRQHLYVSVACLTLLIVAACIPCKQVPPEPAPAPQAAPPAREECDHLANVVGFIGREDFEGAMKESQDVLVGSPKTPPGDEALMNLGLISAHYANPKKDYKKAMGYFMRIEKEFPRSPLVEEARIWIGVLQAFEKAKQVDIEIEEKKKVLGK
jgi:hypothetical protein